MDLVIDAYIAQTGDIYAAYYTEEEYKAIEQANVGKTAGVGISIINSKVTYNGEELLALKVTDLVPDSPAEKAGVLVGDYVYIAITENGDVKINDVGYDNGLDLLLGDVDTFAKIKVLRAKNGGFEEIPFEIQRKQITSRSVRGRVSAADSTLGILHIKEFDYTTPAQFVEEITKLQAKGCTKFVLDLRYNLGGKIVSAGALLSYFLNEGDVYIRTRDRDGNIVNEVVGVISEFEGDRAGCNVKKEEIGMYKDLDVVVLCNESTASAAELFVANFKDYDLGKVIGTNTFGKGKLQTSYRLDKYALSKYGASGITGVIKLTTHEYLPPKSDSYDGIGIVPDIEVPMSEDMKNINIHDYALYDPIDDQLNKAINILNNK
jgi:carboxyl-terminal processing protease